MSTLPKRYTVKVYTNASVYLGDLPDATDVYSMSQEINTAGGEITLTVPVTIDIASLPNTGTLQDESGVDLLDENGNPLLTEGATPAVAVGTGAALIKNGNRVVVYEQSDYAPNGRVIFRGVMEYWKAAIGGDNGDNSVQIKCYSMSSDLNNALLSGPPYTTTLDQSFTTHTSEFTITQNTVGDAFSYKGQTFTVGAGVVNLGVVSLWLNGTADVTLSVYTDTSLTTLLGSVTQHVSAVGGAEVAFTIPVHIPVTSGTVYFFTAQVNAGQSINIGYSGSGTYAGGQTYSRTKVTGSPAPVWGAVTGDDLYFKTYSSTGNTSANYLSVDPTTGMLEDFMNDYRSRGGVVTYNGGSIDATGLTLSYQFNSSRVLEGIQKILELSPSGFYWYIEASTNTLYFKRASLTADVLLTKGIHLESFELTASIENVVNLYYFSGGETSPGVNLYKVYQDGASISLYGQRIDQRSDNRVTLTGTADAIGNSAIAVNKDEVFQTTLKILDGTIDALSLHVGQIVGYRNFGTFIDKLLMQIVRIDYSPEETTLTLGALPVRIDAEFDRINRELVAQQTLANPSTPS